jgi:2-oxoisovalerate dehydrogenase E2 component (dihydrolipoyl transacylase)
MARYLLPDVGEGLTEADIVSWKVAVGERVAVNDIVAEIETAKSLVELPSPYAGIVRALLVPEGQTVDVGTAIIEIDETDQAPAPSATDGPGEAGTSGPNLVGYGPSEAATMRRPRRTASSTSVSQAAGRVLAKPPVRLLAKERGVDLSRVEGTGPGGVVTLADVQFAARSRTTQPQEASSQVTLGAAGPAIPTASIAAGAGRERREPIRGVRKAMATAMVSSAFSAPHVSAWVTVDVTRTMALVEQLKARPEFGPELGPEFGPEFGPVRVSPLLIVARACIQAMRRTPEINSMWDETAGEVVFKRYVHLGIAAATPRGLVVPNIKDAQDLSLPELAVALGALTENARGGRTTPADMGGGTFTITNVGVFGVDGGTPIINPGESAILAFGAVAKRPWVVSSGGGDALAIRQVTTLALSFDHRHIDGAQGCQFLGDVAKLLENPAGLID